MKISKLCIIVFVLVATIGHFLLGWADQVPQLIPYQGRLTDDIGFPVTSMTQVTFSIYSDSLILSPIWTETANLLPAQDGSISWLLGQNCMFDTTLFDGSIRYLGIAINANGEMKPRIPIGSVPYSLGSNVSDLPPEKIRGTAATLTADQILSGANSFTGPTVFMHSDAQNYAVRTENLGGGPALQVLTNSDTDPALMAITGITAQPNAGDPAGNGPIIRGYRAFFGLPQGLDLNLRFSVENDGSVLADGAFVGGGEDFAVLLEVSQDANTLTLGQVLVIDPSQPGLLRLSNEPRSRLVAGVYSEQPGFIGTTNQLSKYTPDMDGKIMVPDLPKQKVNDNRIPVTIVGIVTCNVSAENGPISVGDLLVTSGTAGHAMCSDDTTAIGTVLGKALGELTSGLGQIKILLTLQ